MKLYSRLIFLGSDAAFRFTLFTRKRWMIVQRRPQSTVRTTSSLRSLIVAMWQWEQRQRHKHEVRRYPMRAFDCRKIAFTLKTLRPRPTKDLLQSKSEPKLHPNCLDVSIVRI